MSRFNYHLRAIAGLVLAIFTLAWLAHDRLAAPIPHQVVIATPATEVVNTAKIDVPLMSPIRVYRGGAALKKKIELPVDVVADEHQVILASSKIDAGESHTVTTVINTQTGESQTFVRVDPAPWLGWDDHGGVSLQAGYKNGTPAVRLQATQGLFRIKELHLNALVNLEQTLAPINQLNSFIGIGAEYRW